MTKTSTQTDFTGVLSCHVLITWKAFDIEIELLSRALGFDISSACYSNPAHPL